MCVHTTPPLLTRGRPPTAHASAAHTAATHASADHAARSSHGGTHADHVTLSEKLRQTPAVGKDGCEQLAVLARRARAAGRCSRKSRQQVALRRPTSRVSRHVVRRYT